MSGNFNPTRVKSKVSSLVSSIARRAVSEMEIHLTGLLMDVGQLDADSKDGNVIFPGLKHIGPRTT